MIPARLTVVTLGARDHPALRAFYVGLGWEPVIDLDGFCAFDVQGAVFTLFPIDELAAEAASPEAAPDKGIGFSLAINVDEPDQVDSTLAAARDAGARVTREPVTQDWGGRSAYFADPEDNHWEIACVPSQSNMAKLLRRAAGSD